MSQRRLGMVNMTLFGAGWWVLGASASPGAWFWVVAAVGLSVAVALLAGAWRLPAGQAGEPAESDRRFNAIVVAEFVVIAVVAVGAGGAGPGERIPALVCFVVGAHFLPLARHFATPLYLATGAVLMILAIETLVAVPALDLSEAVWRGLPGFGAAGVLWATSARLAAPGGTRSPRSDRAIGMRQDREASRRGG